MWMETCRNYGISFNEDFSLANVLSDAVQIRNWSLNGLPLDSVSIENAIMMNNNSKYPLMIDPQLQANHWLKKHLRGKLYIIRADSKEEIYEKQSDALITHFMKGHTVLVENVDEVIDNIYNPLISQSWFEENGSLMIEWNTKNKEFNVLRLYVLLTEIELKLTFSNVINL